MLSQIFQLCKLTDTAFSPVGTSAVEREGLDHSQFAMRRDATDRHDAGLWKTSARRGVWPVRPPATGGAPVDAGEAGEGAGAHWTDVSGIERVPVGSPRLHISVMIGTASGVPPPEVLWRGARTGRPALVARGWHVTRGLRARQPYRTGQTGVGTLLPVFVRGAPVMETPVAPVRQCGPKGEPSTPARVG